MSIPLRKVCRNASKQLSGSVRRMSIKPEAQRKEVEWSRRVTLPLADVVHKDAVAVTGSLDLFDERVASKQHDGKQQKRAREQRRKAWMGKEVTPWMENGWDYEGKWRGEHLPEDPTVPYGVLPNAHLRKAVLIKKDSGLKRWIPIVNLPPGDLIEVACSTPGKYHLDPAFWDALCRRAEYISHCFSVKQIRRLLGALASAECKAHPGLLRKMSSELLERFPQLTLLTCSECAEAYQKLEYDHTGTYNMLALAFVQEMEDIRYPLVGSEKSRQSTSPERALQMAAKILTAFSKAKLNGATPNDLLDCCAHTLYSHREVLKDCVDDYIAAVDAYRRFSRAVTAIELARIILASDIALEVHRIGRLARAVHGLEGNVMIATELADCVRASVKDATALRGGDTVELTVQREDHGNELDEFGMPTRRISSRKITIEIDRLIDLIECLMAVGQEVPEVLAKVITNSIDDPLRAVRVLGWRYNLPIEQQNRLADVVRVSQRQLIPHGLREVMENRILAGRGDFLTSLAPLLEKETDRFREDQCVILARVYHGLGTQFNGIVKGCLKQLSNRLSQKRVVSWEEGRTHPGARSEYSGSLLWQEETIDREELVAQVCDTFDSSILHPKLLQQFEGLVPRMSPDQLLRCATILPQAVRRETQRRESDNGYLYGDDNPEEIEQVAKIPPHTVEEILTRTNT